MMSGPRGTGSALASAGGVTVGVIAQAVLRSHEDQSELTA